MTKTLIICCFIFTVQNNGAAQIFFNANTDLTIGKGQTDSDYYHNGINSNKRDWRLGFSKITGLLGSQFGDQWTVMSQVALKRKNDVKLDQFLVEQLHVRWDALNSFSSVSVGRVIHPFGSFYQKQLSPDLTFLEVPLSYGYYINVSDRIGYMTDLGENGFKINNQTQWGQSLNYRYGYLTGFLFQHTSKNQKLQYDVAFGNNSFIGESLFNDPLKWQIVSRVGWQATWFSQLGFSTRLAFFKNEDQINTPILDDTNFRQWQMALDYKVGISLFEISGEIKSSMFHIPEFQINEGFLISATGVDVRRFSSFSSFIDVKYEPTVLPGSYIALRLESIQFSKDWDQNVRRYSVAGGYKLNRNVLLRFQYSIQQVDSHSWQQNFFKSVVTIHI